MQPQSSDHQFDFMLKNNQPVKSGGVMPKLPKPVMIGVGIVLAVILLIIISSTLSGRKNGATQPIVGSLTRGQELIRVTGVVQTLGLQDPSTKAVAATTLAVLTSDHQQLVQYLASNKVKITDAQISADTDKTVDTQMQAAFQNSNLDQAYITYLQQYLPKYQTDLQNAYKTAPGPKGKAILKTAYDSETILLATAPLKS